MKGEKEEGLGRKSLRTQSSSENVSAGLMEHCLRGGEGLVLMPLFCLAIEQKQPGGSVASAGMHSGS